MKKISIAAIYLLTIFLTSAHANEKEQLKETVAFMLNLKGHLCAKVTEIVPLQVKNQYEVTCVAYRGGKGTKVYVFNATDGTAFEQ